MGTIKTTNIEPIADNGTVTLGSSGDTFTLGSGVVQSNLNYPAFCANMSANQSLTNLTITKVQFDTEILDTDGYYDNTTNYRFTPLVAGKYLVTAQTTVDGDPGEVRLVQTYIRKNGSTYVGRALINYHGSGDAEGGTTNASAIVDMNGSTDYLEAMSYADIQSGSANVVAGEGLSNFYAYRIGS